MKYIFILLGIFLTIESFSQSCGWKGKLTNMAFPVGNSNITTGWHLYEPFSDEFYGIELNNTKWEIRNDYCHPMSKAALFRNTSNQVKVENGKLILSVFEEPASVECCIGANCTDYNYSSGLVKSVNKIQYGYLEMKCYIPNSIALNPCFWLWGQIGSNGNPDYQYDEIDVFERNDPPSVVNTDKKLMSNFYHNLHDTYSGTRSDLMQSITFETPFVGDTSVFAVEWLPHEIHFYVNGKITRSVRYSSRTDHNTDSYFTCTDFEDAIAQKMIFSFSVNNEIYNYPDISESFEIHYIRSYKLQEGYNFEYWPSSFNLSNPNLFKVHKSLRLGGIGHSAIIPSNENITVWAKEGIVLDKGFQVTGNTNFTARTIETSENSNLFK